MKTILVPTDFSPAAENAAKYAVQLARYTKAEVKLLNAVKVPAEAPMAAQVAWPLQDYQTIKTDTNQELRILANHLSLKTAGRKDTTVQYQPKISYCCHVGNVAAVVKSTAIDHDINLVLMGLWNASSINRFLTGSTSHEMIEEADIPLMLIPPDAKFKPIKTIAFATNLSEQDVAVIHSLASLARVFNAEILLIHVTDGQAAGKDPQTVASDFLTMITNRVNYPYIYYRSIEANNVDTGLAWLLEHRELEILAMVHRKHNMLDRLFNHSHSQHMARYSSLPLLIFPAANKAIVF